MPLLKLTDLYGGGVLLCRDRPPANDREAGHGHQLRQVAHGVAVEIPGYDPGAADDLGTVVRLLVPRRSR